VAELADWREVLAKRRDPRQTDAEHRVILLGTAGGSNPKATRAGYANAVVVGDAAYLVDCGEGAHRQLWRAGLTLNPVRDPDRPAVRALFVTHLHADHIMDLGNLLLGSWPTPVLDVYGPVPAGLPIPVFPPDAMRPLVFPDAPTPGIQATVDQLLRAYAYNINLRVADEGRIPVTESVSVHELDLGRGEIHGRDEASVAPDMAPVVVYPEDDHGVTVSAVLVQHAPVFPAFGFRFDTPHGSVVFSGDTGPCANVARLAQGADILVHEVIEIEVLARRLQHLPNYQAVRNHLASSHSTPEQVGDIASRAGVRILVLSHLVPGDLDVTEAEWEARVRPHFTGEVVCGVDLDEFPLVP
jgi:ribonuclease BN (tRNA processing enzyme)